MRRPDHLSCETCYQLSLICTSVICGVFMKWSTFEVLSSSTLAYFVAKKGEKNGISILSICLLVCIYFAHMYAYACIVVVAFIFQLFQVLGRCCHVCYNILMFLMMIWDYVLSIFNMYMFHANVHQHVRSMSKKTCVDVGIDAATSLWCYVLGIYFSQYSCFVLVPCSCSLKILELVCGCCMHLYLAADATTSY